MSPSALARRAVHRRVAAASSTETSAFGGTSWYTSRCASLSASVGADAGPAPLYDLALLAVVYVVFAGFLHGAAMVAPAGVAAGESAAMAAPWLTAMTGAFQVRHRRRRRGLHR
ncbi:imine reductase family protein [Streptomyces tricolor]